MDDTAKKGYALVTGGGSGLGKAFCCRLAADNWHVVVVDIDVLAAEQTVKEIVTSGGAGQAEQLDVTNSQAWNDLADRLKGNLPRLDLLINNAGICSSGELGNTSLDNFLRTVDVNLRGVLFGCHTMIPWLKETSPGGQIVNIASIFGVISPPAMGAYNLSKAGVISLSETLAAELFSTGIGVTVVMPGFFKTRLLEKAHFDSEAQQVIATEYMQNSHVTAEDVVEQTLKAVKRRELYVVLGSKARWYWRFKRFMPRTLVRIVARRFRQKMQKYEQPN